jgi:hypothetical protein
MRTLQRQAGGWRDQGQPGICNDTCLKKKEKEREREGRREGERKEGRREGGGRGREGGRKGQKEGRRDKGWKKENLKYKEKIRKKCYNGFI